MPYIPMEYRRKPPCILSEVEEGDLVLVSASTLVLDDQFRCYLRPDAMAYYFAKDAMVAKVTDAIYVWCGDWDDDRWRVCIPQGPEYLRWWSTPDLDSSLLYKVSTLYSKDDAIKKLDRHPEFVRMGALPHS